MGKKKPPMKKPPRPITMNMGAEKPPMMQPAKGGKKGGGY